MRLPGDCQAILLFILMVILAVGCAAPPPHSPEGDFYLLTDMTYMRDTATFDSNVVGQLYKGDQVEKLEAGPPGWWRVRSGRTGQNGWVSAELFTPTPVPVPLFSVTHTVSLRECPKEFCPSLQQLSRGDQVQRVEQNDQGWCRVLVAKSHNLGWLPAKVLAEHLEEPQAKAPEPLYYFVAVRRLTLRREPLVTAEAVTLLQFNDQVERQDRNPAGWVKVRQPASGAVGWVQERYLEVTPLKYPRFEKPKKKKPTAPPAKPAETAPQAEPEIM
jgi:uncharacterized protein YgiM (DUF1202 family)